MIGMCFMTSMKIEIDKLFHIWLNLQLLLQELKRYPSASSFFGVFQSMLNPLAISHNGLIQRQSLCLPINLIWKKIDRALIETPQPTGLFPCVANKSF